MVRATSRRVRELNLRYSENGIVVAAYERIQVAFLCERINERIVNGL